MWFYAQQDNFIWALSVVPAGQFAKVGQSDVELFTALARVVEQHVLDFNLQDLANTA